MTLEALTVRGRPNKSIGVVDTRIAGCDDAVVRYSDNRRDFFATRDRMNRRG
jgi:hypothetical protein